ncbi:glycosidase [Streptomyces sp. SAI-124]|uniref:alpha-amylase family glycosyl hydrolase n=1 Tax=Streptomyces sp. SAI-124 TaxID=3377730 RepID=UPI003C7BC366
MTSSATPPLRRDRTDGHTRSRLTPERPRGRSARRRSSRAATLLALALPGSSYLYQGEELGLPEVFDIPAELAQDPSAIIENGIAVAGRDGCRVPLPWTKGGTFFGFSDRATHPPQPEWFGAYSVEAESADDQSTLTLYRRALHLRRSLQTEERLEWLDHGGVDVLAFTRPNGWTSITNFGTSPVPLPSGSVVIRTDHKPAGVPLDPMPTPGSLATDAPVPGSARRHPVDAPYQALQRGPLKCASCSVELW